MLDGTGSSDPDSDPLTYAWTAPASVTFDDASATPTATFPGLGTFTISLVVNDGTVNSAPDTVDIKVEDTTAPVISSASAGPSAPWPPNHKMRPVRVSVDVSDACDAKPTCRIISVTSNEDVNGTGDGNTSLDWEITCALTVDLRAERSGTGDGRVYTITLRCMDARGNASQTEVSVTVPHDQSM